MRILSAVYGYAIFYLGLMLFGAICLGWSLFAVALHPLLPSAFGRSLGRRVIMLVFRFFLFCLGLSGRFRFDLRELDQLRHEKSIIIAANHPSLWDAVLIVSRLPDVACIMKAQIINNVFLGAGARLARYIRNDSLRKMIKIAVQNLERGSRLLLFPEGTRTVRPPIGPLTGSIAVIAQRAKAPVQTVIIETDSLFLCKGWPVYRKPVLPIRYRVRLGRRFNAPECTAGFMSELEQYFASEVSKGSARREPVDGTAVAPAALAATDAIHQ